MIEARALSVNGTGRTRLDAVDCTVAHGEFVAVLGPNGAGKSTLLRVLAGDLRPDAGDVRLDGRALDTWPRTALARRRAVLGATTSQLAWPVREIVALGRLPHEDSASVSLDAACIAYALDVAGLAPLASRSFAALSAGEQARVQFARCIAQLEPQANGLLLMDEPVAHADLKHQHALLAAAHARTRRGGAVLAILHDPNQALHYADRVLLLREGRVVASGTPVDVLSPSLLSDVYEVSVRRAAADGIALLGVVPSGAPPIPSIVNEGEFP